MNHRIVWMIQKGNKYKYYLTDQLGRGWIFGYDPVTAQEFNTRAAARDELKFLKRCEAAGNPIVPMGGSRVVKVCIETRVTVLP